MDLPKRIWPAIRVLMEAARYAAQTGSNRWEFAVEMDQLMALGLTPNDFRWLVRQELVAHQREVTLESDDGRDFRPTGDLTFPDRTCFVLTDEGMRVARECCSRASPLTAEPPCFREADDLHGNCDPAGGRHDPLPVMQAPEWDPARRVLKVNGITVKHFKWSAVNQEAVLAAFQEEGWPSRIDDPLPPHPGQDAKRRLSDTIKCLNRNHQHELIHFRGDGSGEGIVWELVRRDADSATRSST